MIYIFNWYFFCHQTKPGGWCKNWEAEAGVRWWAKEVRYWAKETRRRSKEVRWWAKETRRRAKSGHNNTREGQGRASEGSPAQSPQPPLDWQGGGAGDWAADTVQHIRRHTRPLHPQARLGKVSVKLPHWWVGWQELPRADNPQLIYIRSSADFDSIK